MPPTTRIDRRRFLKHSAAAAGAFALPYFIPASAFGANERIVTGHIGVGGMGRGNLGPHLTHAAALCDVDQNNLARAVKMVESKGGKCEAYGDYRKLLERKDIDAVFISTPDHWHALPTIAACNAGMDVYIEKPLSHTVEEGRQMVEAARNNKRIVQVGSWQRSLANFPFACEAVRAGRLGKLQKILVGIAAANHPFRKKPPVPDSDPPAALDYDFWLGPAPQRPYNVNRVHYNFRFFWDYSGGQMTNWGAHYIDIAHWGMGLDGGGPLEIEGTATFHPQLWHDVPETCRVTYKYPNDVTMIVGQQQEDIPIGTTFIGEKGSLFVARGHLKSTPADLLGPLEKGISSTKNGVKKHHANFLDCIKTRQLPVCDVAIGHSTATACHLGNLACRTGRKIRWDAEKETILGDEAAEAMLRREYRAPWNI